VFVRASFAHLTTFDAVARALSFTRAARRLHITQGAVSQRIRALEGDLGVQLFERSTRAVRLTAAGEILHRATRDALDRVEAGLVEMNALGKESQVTVSCSPSFAIRWLVPHLGALRAAAPEVNLHIAADDRLIAPGPGSVDLCIRYGQGGYGGRVRRICTEALRPVCNPLYLRHHPMRTPADLASAMLLHDDVLLDHPGHLGWQEWLSHAGVSGVDGSDGLHFSHSHLALDAAAAGQGIALGRTILVERDLQAGRLVMPFGDSKIDSTLTYWLITPSGGPTNPALESFCQWFLPMVGRENDENDLDL